ncbi:enolase C-terminal domain-like protein [Conexibacter arvalis]|uniref:glucarate dehydratase n=1 Tax=Conexibacter arvalis TaxID=912552 RepID=A0A840IDI7_9ACTN|nr:enolase C-terminal domain-like protein [Conexibacter arvalis]MBB4662415.1 glucarate dehydratase [Conexibacter arvalis]
MRIREIRATPVLVPMRRPLLHSSGTETGTARTVIELITDEGAIGIGETRGGASVAAMVEAARELWVGVDVLEAARIARRFSYYRVTSEQLHVVGAMKLAGAGVEMACWDAAGRSLGKRAGDLWGGIERERIEFAAYAFYRYASSSPDERTVESVVDHAIELVETHGFRDVKVKNGIKDPEEELADVRRLRSELGTRMRHLRIDPNQVWSVATAVRFLSRAAELDIEFCEDPVAGIEGMGRVNAMVPVPLATNMCCVSFEQVPDVVRARALDVILGDVHFWGGPVAAGQLARVCDTFSLGFSLHSDRELGVSTAAMLHFAAAHPQIRHAIDSHLPEQVDDVITEPHTFVDGTLAVPEGPGLGVELDPEKVAKYARLYEEQGEADEFRNPWKPEWWPVLPLY